MKNSRKTVSGGTKRSTVKKGVVAKKQRKDVDQQKSKDAENEFMVSVSRTGLKKAVDMVSNALHGKEYLDAKSGIFLEAKYEDGEPTLCLTANSLDVFITHKVILQDDIGEGFVVPNGNSFHKIISGLQSLSESIDLSFDENAGVFEINCGTDYEGIIQHYDSMGFVFPPNIDEIKQNEEVKMQMKFITEALDKVAFACSNDTTMSELTGVYIEQKEKAINFIGGDGNRIAFLSVKSRIKNPKSVIVGVKYLKLLNSILKTLEVKQSDVITLYLSDEKIYFISDNTTVGIQIFAGDYPIDGGYERFVHDIDECEAALTLDVSKFLEKLDLATLHNNSVLEPVCMNISAAKKKMDYRFVNTEMSGNKFNISFAAGVDKYDGESMEIVFTPSYLYDILKAINSKQVILGIVNDAEATIVPVGVSDEEYCYTFSLN